MHGPSPLWETAVIAGFGRAPRDGQGQGVNVLASGPQDPATWATVRRWSEYTLYRITLDYLQVPGNTLLYCAILHYIDWAV